MLLSSYFVLNRTKDTHQHTIYPYVHTFSNVRHHAHIIAPITIPDVRPGDLPDPSDFSLVAGDFIEIYGVGDEESQRTGKESHEGAWDAVLTCFFIDTVRRKRYCRRGSLLLKMPLRRLKTWSSTCESSIAF